MSIPIILYLKAKDTNFSLSNARVTNLSINIRTLTLLNRTKPEDNFTRSSRSTLHAPLHHFASSARVAGVVQFRAITESTRKSLRRVVRLTVAARLKVSRLYSIVKLYHISFLLSRHWCIQILLNHVKLLSLYIFFCRLVHTKNRIRRFRIKRKNHIYFIFIWVWLYENVIAKIVYRFKFKRKYVTLPPNRITLVSLNQKWHSLKLLQNIGTRERDFQENEIYIYILATTSGRRYDP